MDKIAILDFGGQYTHLIANRVRRLGVFSEIVPNTASSTVLCGYKGIILSGGPHSVIEAGAPLMDADILSLGIPVLGLCYGHQLIVKLLGGEVESGAAREYGVARLDINCKNELFAGLSSSEQVWMSHGDSIKVLPKDFYIIASTSRCKAAAIAHTEKKIFGLQFHPEVTDTPRGMQILENFVNICGCCRDWNPDSFFKEISLYIKEKCGSRKVFMLVSGGVDSTVAFVLLNNVLGPRRVVGVHIDNGLMRENESNEIFSIMQAHGFTNLRVVDASERFLCALKKAVDPEEKRKIIGDIFLQITFDLEKELGLNCGDWILAQGTIYPDTIESAATQHADKIKTHHNRVEAIQKLIDSGLVIEPLSQLYKDEVRRLAEMLGLAHSFIWRHPFPGPGLGVRVLCSNGSLPHIPESLRNEAANIASGAGYSATVLPVRSVGVQGDARSYCVPVLLKGPRDWSALENISTTITNQLKGVNRVVYTLFSVDNSEYSLCPSYISRSRLNLLRRVDTIVTEELIRSGEYEQLWQVPVILLPLLNKNADESVVIRPVQSQEAMTARFVPLKDQTIEAIIKRCRDIKGIGDIFIDITHKPPATIEWE